MQPDAVEAIITYRREKELYDITEHYALKRISVGTIILSQNFAKGTAFLSFTKIGPIVGRCPRCKTLPLVENPHHNAVLRCPVFHLRGRPSQQGDVNYLWLNWKDRETDAWFQQPFIPMASRSKVRREKLNQNNYGCDCSWLDCPHSIQIGTVGEIEGMLFCEEKWLPESPDTKQ